jgi:alpha-glucosidase (family GH31 glycosyl hydrolase)
VPGDISRREDTEYRGYYGQPALISGLAVAYGASAAPNYYPDIVMGTNQVDSGLNADEERYFVRNATLAAVMPAMAFGYGPWNITNATYRAKVKNAADWHTKFQPYIYSAAVDSFNTGYPHTLTPLPVAFPDQPGVYDTPEAEWMLGPSMLATGACFKKASFTEPVPVDCTADVVLPAGTWFDFETGQRFTGPTTLQGYAFPIGKLPVFVGGKGTVVFRDPATGSLRAKVYPVVAGGSVYRFTDADGSTTSTVTNNNTGWSPATLTVRDTTTGALVATEHEAGTGAFRFTLVPGHNYTLTGGA